MVVFAVLIVGGLYSYSLVPAGASVQEWMGRPRNDYDRLGHFMQGFAPALRVARVRGRHLCRRRRSQLSRRAGRCVGRAMGHAVLDLHTNHGHPQRQVCACQKECVSCRVCVPIHRSSARLLLRWSSRKGCPFARRLIDWGFHFTRWTIGSVVVAPNKLCKCHVVHRRRVRKLRLACARWKQMCVD